jgi:hypothetical protein
MSISTRNHRFSYLGTLAVAAAISVAALVSSLSPAKAQGWAGVQVGPFAFGVGTPPPTYPYPYHPYGYYYSPSPYYYYPSYYYYPPY